MLLILKLKDFARGPELEALEAETGVFKGQELCNSEAVVDLGEVDVRRA